jgi:hypothetical protein
VDAGANGLREAANIGYGIACVIGATILLMRCITNVVVSHPHTKKSERNIAYFETCLLAFAWMGTLVGMAASGLGYEPKTGWAVFSVAVFAIIGYAVCYAYELADVNAALEGKSQGELLNVGVQGPMTPIEPAGSLTGMVPQAPHTVYRPPSVGSVNTAPARPTSSYSARPNV